MPRIFTYLACLALALAGATVPASPAAADTVTKRLYRAISDFPLAKENRSGYNRDLFRHWIDADQDCRDTRDEVLARESLVAVSGCDIQVGKWRSYYDGVVTRSSSDFDIDHLVPLAEAWDSGARRWTAGTRKRFANDLGDRRSLVAVTASSNRSKSDQDPAGWMPARNRCRYVREWVAVKIRWRLKVNRPEKRALRTHAEDCRNLHIRVNRAVVRPRSTSAGGATGLDPRFDTCGDAKAAGYGPYYQGKDPEYEWYIDGDGDGIACE